MDVVSYHKTTNVCLHFESTEYVKIDKFIVSNKSIATSITNKQVKNLIKK